MGNGAVKRYMGGKRPDKFFKEDVWPEYGDVCTKLGMGIKKCLAIFLIFCKIDTDESGSVDVDEAFAYMGGTRTKFTERIFDIKDKVSAKSGLQFGAFMIVLWNYCSFTQENLARYLFEIFDIDNKGTLEKPDIETMYRMMYDCDDFDEKYINRFPFSQNDVISKADFIRHVYWNSTLIKPALRYQKRLRKYLGGIVMWNGLMLFRERYFKLYQESSATLEEALNAILESENKNKGDDDADALLLAKKEKLENEIQEAKNALKRREIQLKMQLKVKITPEERQLKIAENAFNEKYEAFGKRQFTTDDVWERRELREELFELFDEYIEIKNKTIEETNQRNTILTEGVEEDHEARYQDHILTKLGSHEYDRLLLTEVYAELTKRYPPKETMTIGEAKRVSMIMESSGKLAKLKRMVDDAVKKAQNLTLDNPLDPKQPNYDLVLGIDLTEDKAFAKRNAKSSDFATADVKVVTLHFL